MSEVIDGMCIIDAISGIDCATPQIGQFTDNFDKVKFLLGKDFNDYTMIIVTDINGHVEIVNTDGEILIKESTNGETSLVWNIGANITAESGVVIYQIVAYKGNGESIEKVWYSKEGRLIVTDSISTNEYGASLIGSYPNLLTRLLIDIDALQKELETRCNLKVDIVEGMGLSQNSFSNEEKEKLSAIEEGAEVNVTSDWQEDDENSDSYIKNKPILASVATSGSYTDLKDKPIVDNSYAPESQNAQSGTAVAQALANLVNSSPEALNTLYELASALGNDPNFAETVAKQIGTKVDKIEGKELSSNDYTDAEKEKLASVQQGAERNVISDWAEEDANSDKFIKNKPRFSKVALSGSYNDLSDKPLFASVAKSGSYRDLTDTPQIPSVEGLASEEYVNTRLEEKADKATKINGKSLSEDINLTASDVGALSSSEIVEGFGVPFDVSGTNIVTIEKVHPKEHDVEVLTDAENVTVCGKNLIPFPYTQTSKTENGITFTVNDDGSVLVNGTATKTTQFYISTSRFEIPKTGTYCYSGCPSGGKSTTYNLYVSKSDSNGWVAEKVDTGNGVTWLYEEGYTYRFTIYVYKDAVCENLLFKPMLEVGSLATEYETYKGATYPVTNSKATVKSVSPTMNITSATSGASIEAKGYRDGLAVIDELKQAIISLGGNI